MACETYDDGSWFCEDQYGWQYEDATGYYQGYYNDAGQPVNANGNLVTIADAVSSVFGGGQRGYYAPNRNQQVLAAQFPNQYQYGYGVNAQTSVNRGGVGTSLNVSTNTLMLIAGGVLIYLVAKGRR